MENADKSSTNENEVADICQNLTIEQMVARTYRQLPPEIQSEYDAISRRTGIQINALLLEALDIGLPLLAEHLQQSLGERTMRGER